MMLSESFSLREFTYSETAARMGREVVPTTQQVENARRLCQVLLQPIRDALGRPIVISSGIRPDWLNAAIKGAPNSAHMSGRAVDVRVVGMTPLTFVRWVQRQNCFPIDKALVEFGSWTHLQIADGANKPRQQYLNVRHDAGRTVFETLA